MTQLPLLPLQLLAALNQTLRKVVTDCEFDYMSHESPSTPTHIRTWVQPTALVCHVLCVTVSCLVHSVVPPDVGDVDDDLPLEISVSAACLIQCLL